MAETADYTRGNGPDAPAYGEATNTNTEAQQGRDAAQQIADETTFVEGGSPPPSDSGGGVPQAEFDNGPDPTFTPKNEMDQILFGDSEGISAPPEASKMPVPNSVLRALPLLATIVNDPGTPIAIVAAYRKILQDMADELDRRG